MEELCKLIMQHYNSDRGAMLREKLTDGLHALIAPQGVVDADNSTSAQDDQRVYAVFTFPGGNVSDTMSSKIEEPVVTFTIYQTAGEGTQENAEDPTAILMARDALTLCYDDVLYTMADDMDNTQRRHITARRMTAGLLMAEPDGGFMCPIDYRFEFCIG